MDGEKIELSVVSKGEFAGIFSLCPVSREEIETAGIQELASLRELWMPILGFRKNRTDYSYSIGKLDDHCISMWKDRLYPRAERSFALDSISLIFASLETPDDFYHFAKCFGPLFAFAENSVDPYYPIEQPNKHLLLDLFGLTDGKKATNKTSFLESNSDENKVCSFESLSDWIVASGLLKLAFTLSNLSNEAFRYRSEDSHIEIYYEDQRSLFEIIPLGDNWFSIPLRLKPLESAISEYRINSESEYCTILNGRAKLHSERRSNSNFYCTHGIYADDLGYLRIDIKLPSFNKACIKTLRNAMQSICDCLFQLHCVNMQLTLHNGIYQYCFDSLLTYLWYDFSQVMISSRGISVCSYCGKPFFRNNGGHARKYCNDVCRNNAKNQRDRRHNKK